MQLVVRRGLVVAAVGIVLGFGVAIGMSRLLDGLLYGVTSSDPASLLAVAALTLGIALLASWAPSRRAVRVDPTASLRSE